MTPRYEIDLTLTTPHMKGTKVKEAQHLLAHNRYDHGFDPGRVDGEYGRHTAAAVRRAKFYLGYPTRRCTARFGPRLYAYLVPKTSRFFQRRPPTYYARSVRRIRAEKRRERTRFRQQAVHLALSKRGVHESPAGSNNVIFNTWYYGHPVYGASTYPWCAVFVSWVFSHVGRPLRYASVSQIYYDAANRRNGLELVGTPRPGDLACLDHLGHIGIFLRMIGSSFEYVSGNTGSTSEADGGTVDVHTLPRSIVNGWVRVNRR